jgi:hypothetical protein
MITGSIDSFLSRCKQRGYSFEDCAACIVSITVDETHPAYPAALPASDVTQHLIESIQKKIANKTTGKEPQLEHQSRGPGTELKKLLAKIGIVATQNCSCNSRARRMDEEEAKEPGWCEAHLDEIVGWLREEAEKRKLPFVDMAGRLLVRRAIKNARRAAAG